MSLRDVVSLVGATCALALMGIALLGLWRLNREEEAQRDAMLKELA